MILDAVIAYFTGGSSLVAEASAKISRLTAKAEQTGAKALNFSKNLGKKITNTAQDLFKWLEKEFLEMIEAIKNGKVAEWLKKKIDAIFGDGNKQLGELYGLGGDELDWMASRNIGTLGGKILKASQIRKLRGILKEKGIHLIMEDDIKSIIKLFKPIGQFDKVEDLFYFMKLNGKAGAFNPYTKQMILPRNTTEIVVFHEMAHIKQFEQIGEEAYKNLSTLEKETYVWKQIIENRQKWTEAELNDALGYINRERKKAGIKESININ